MLVVDIYTAIYNKNIQELQSLLLSGDFANARALYSEPPPQIGTNNEPNCELNRILDPRIYPLAYAIHLSLMCPLEESSDDKASRMRTVETLLKHDADPYATISYNATR